MAELLENMPDEDDDVIDVVLGEVKKFVGSKMVEQALKEYNDLKQRFLHVQKHDKKTTTDKWDKMTANDKMAVISTVNHVNSDYETITDILQRARSYGINKSTSATLTVARYLYFSQDQSSDDKHANLKLEIDDSTTIDSNPLTSNSNNHSDGFHKNQKPITSRFDDDINEETIERLSPVLGENLDTGFPSNARTSTPATFVMQNGVRTQSSVDQGNNAIYEAKLFALTEQIRVLNEKNADLTRENLQQKNSIDEMQSRTADDSDIITPSYVARMMENVKDKEWKDAFYAMKEDVTPILAMEKLTSIIDRIYAFCQEVAITQLIKLEQHMTKCVLSASATYTGKEVTEEAREDTRLSTITTKTAKEYRKSVAKSCVPAVQKLYQSTQEHSLQTIRERNNPIVVSKVDPYINKCVEFCWYICVQDPPLRLKFTRPGDRINKETFSMYENDGEVTKVCVWPALLNSEDAATIQKGLVLPV